MKKKAMNYTIINIIMIITMSLFKSKKILQTSGEESNKKLQDQLLNYEKKISMQAPHRQISETEYIYMDLAKNEIYKRSKDYSKNSHRYK